MKRTGYLKRMTFMFIVVVGMVLFLALCHDSFFPNRHHAPAPDYIDEIHIWVTDSGINYPFQEKSGRNPVFFCFRDNPHSFPIA